MSPTSFTCKEQLGMNSFVLMISFGNGCARTGSTPPDPPAQRCTVLPPFSSMPVIHYSQRSSTRGSLKQQECIIFLFLWVQQGFAGRSGPRSLAGCGQGSAWAAGSCEDSNERGFTKSMQVAAGRPQVLAACWLEASLSFSPLALSKGQLATLQLALSEQERERARKSVWGGKDSPFGA